jgi:hypothetical protein
LCLAQKIFPSYRSSFIGIVMATSTYIPFFDACTLQPLHDQLNLMCDQFWGKRLFFHFNFRSLTTIDRRRSIGDQNPRRSPAFRVDP